jgi:hypothetical protein
LVLHNCVREASDTNCTRSISEHCDFDRIWLNVDRFRSPCSHITCKANRHFSSTPNRMNIDWISQSTAERVAHERPMPHDQNAQFGLQHDQNAREVSQQIDGKD